MTNLSSLALHRIALPGRLPEKPNVWQQMEALRQVRDVLAGVVPVDLSPADAEAIRRVAAESEKEEIRWARPT